MSKKKVQILKSNTRKSPVSRDQKVHPLRLRPIGEHWVRPHPMHVPPTERNPAGRVTTRTGHCARNPSGKDKLRPAEILELSKKKFSNLKKKPCPIDLGFGNVGNKYDELIAGWVEYWNTVFNPKDPLYPNLVKALIATESRFVENMLANKKNQNSARGLMQITNSTRKILGDEKGELKEHFIAATRADFNNPSVNICAGIRWLFHKRKLASSNSKQEATWEKVIYKYKGGDTVKPERAKELIKRFSEKWELLKKCDQK